MLRIWLLGQFEVQAENRRTVIPARAAQSLLAFLVLTAGTPHRREKLAGMLWPDMSDEGARRNLRHELWRLRKALGANQSTITEYILSEEFAIQFNLNADYWLDVAQLERAPAPDETIVEMIARVGLYRGELLPGFYDDWVGPERDRVQALFENRMDELVRRLLAEERWLTAIEWAERWIALGHTPEAAYRALMRAHSAQGETSKIALDYERCAEALREDLDIDPSNETRALYERLTRGEIASPAALEPSPTIFVQSSGTVTFLFSDIEGSTKLLDRLGAEYARLLAEHQDVIRSIGEKFNGHEIDTQGDSFFFAFFRAADAVAFAAESQRALALHKFPQDAHVRVRMGLHTGEPMLARTGYVGMDVHRAARIGAAGHGGQVLLSPTTRALVENELPNGTTLRDLGEHKLKDLRYPVHIVQLMIDGLPAEFPPLKSINTGSEPPAPGEPPFKGLEFFDEADANLFFGREQLIEKLAREVHQNRFLAVVVGASGSGKSSVVRAGLVPALKDVEGNKGTEGTWRVFVMTPTAHPLEALATVLTREESLTVTAQLLDDLAREPRSLHLFIRRQMTDERTQTTNPRSLSSAPRYLVVVDQFEELFTLCHDDLEREQFIDNLVNALGQTQGIAPTSPVHPFTSSPPHSLTLVLTIRADFYAHLAEYPELRDLVAKQQEYIGPMNAEELRRAIQEPAKRGHWEFEPGLVDLILRDVGEEPGALPLLSHALLETWKRRSGYLMTLKGYHDAGGVRGAIAHTAESTYQQLSPEQQNIARNIFVRLTELGEGTEDTRRRAEIGELEIGDWTRQDVRQVLTMLADARLITTGEHSAEVAHEALIREWPRLREWLNQDREGLKLHRALTEAANEWELLERDPSVLYRGARLAAARELVSTNPERINELERAFLEASEEREIWELREREEQQRRELEAAQKLAAEQRRSAGRLRWFAAGLSLFLLVAIAAAYFAFNQSNVAQENFVQAERIRLASQAQIALDNGEGGDLPALLSLQSLKHGYSPEADASLLNALKRGFTKEVFSEHTDLIWEVSISPDSKKVVTTSNDGTARVWDLETAKELNRFAPGVRILTSSGYLPDSKHVVVGGSSEVLWMWDTETNQAVRQYNGLAGGSWGLDVSTDGNYVVSSNDKGARLFDLRTGQLVRDFNPSVMTSPARFSPDGKFVATANGDKTASVWDVATGKELHRFHASVPWVMFSPDSKSLFSGSGNVGQIWEMDAGQETQRFLGHTGDITVGKFSPDGRYLATAGADKTARLWDVTTGQTVKEFVGHTGSIFGLEISRDGRYLVTASGDKTARLWEIQSQIEPQSVKTFGTGNELTWGGTPITLSPDSQFMLANSTAVGETRNKELTIWNTRTGDLRRIVVEITVCTCSLPVFGFSPDNRLLVGGGDDGTLWLWHADSGKLLNKSRGPSAPIRAVLFSHDGRMMLSGGEDKIARLWDPQSGKELQQFVGHTEPIRAVAFSRDGKFVLTGSDDKSARLWDVATGKELKQFLGHSAPLRGVAFSPDGKFIVTGGDDQTARIWDVESAKEIKQLIGHTGQVSQVAFSPDGQFVLTGSADQSARLWNVSTGELARNFVGHTSPVLYSAFTDNGRTIITGDSQNAYRWRASLDDVIAFACSQLTRDLTDDERALYRISDTAPICAKFSK